jgi:hypothetical protein
MCKLKHVEARWNTLKHVETRWNTFKHVETRLNTLKHVETRWHVCLMVPKPTSSHGLFHHGGWVTSDPWPRTGDTVARPWQKLCGRCDMLGICLRNFQDIVIRPPKTISESCWYLLVFRWTSYIYIHRKSTKRLAFDMQVSCSMTDVRNQSNKHGNWLFEGTASLLYR